MFCPETIVLNSRWLMIIRHEKSDYHHGTPWGQVLNLLRYELVFFPGPNHFDINDMGWLARAWSDLNWRLWKRQTEKREAGK